MVNDSRRPQFGTRAVEACGVRSMIRCQRWDSAVKPRDRARSPIEARCTSNGTPTASPMNAPSNKHRAHTSRDKSFWLLKSPRAAFAVVPVTILMAVWSSASEGYLTGRRRGYLRSPASSVSSPSDSSCRVTAFVGPIRSRPMTLLPRGFTDRGGKLIVPTLVVWVSATLRPFGDRSPRQSSTAR